MPQRACNVLILFMIIPQLVINIMLV